MRVVGLDVSRTVAEIAYLEDGRIRAGGRVELQYAALHAFARRLHPTDEVVLEATGNTQAIVAALKAHVARVVVANPLQVRLIAEAKVKTDKIDAAVMAQLYASGFLPEVWIPDADTRALRRQVARRAQIVRQAYPAEERDPLGAGRSSGPEVSGRGLVRQERASLACPAAATAG